MAFKIKGQEVDTTKGLKDTFRQLREIEDKSLTRSISGVILNINNIPYILTKVSYTKNTVNNRMDNIYWCLIGMTTGIRYYDPLTFDELTENILKVACQGKVEVIGYIDEYITQLYNILGIQTEPMTI